MQRSRDQVSRRGKEQLVDTAPAIAHLINSVGKGVKAAAKNIIYTFKKVKEKGPQPWLVVAQWIECRPVNQRVAGSIPSLRKKERKA